MRIAAIDIGSNSTRLLVADVVDGVVDEVFRRSIVTRLGDGVDTAGALNDAARSRVIDALGSYQAEFEAAGCELVGGVATSAMREASNGGEFVAEIRDRLGIEIEIIGGDREAELTFAGASGVVGADGRAMVVDIGGGSTEFIVGDAGELTFHVSTKLGAVRQSERHLQGDPPAPDELDALLAEAGALIREAVPAEFRAGVARGIAVAGTPTVLAAIDLALVDFDPWKVHGHEIIRGACERMLAQLAALPLAERREVIGLHPDRAPTIVAGAAILLATLQAFDLDAVEVSEHDILYGTALALAARA